MIEIFLSQNQRLLNLATFALGGEPVLLNLAAYHLDTRIDVAKLSSSCFGAKERAAKFSNFCFVTKKKLPICNEAMVRVIRDLRGFL